MERLDPFTAEAFGEDSIKVTLLFTGLELVTRKSTLEKFVEIAEGNGVMLHVIDKRMEGQIVDVIFINIQPFEVFDGFTTSRDMDLHYYCFHMVDNFKTSGNSDYDLYKFYILSDGNITRHDQIETHLYKRDPRRDYGEIKTRG